MRRANIGSSAVLGLSQKHAAGAAVVIEQKVEFMGTHAGRLPVYCEGSVF